MSPLRHNGRRASLAGLAALLLTLTAGCAPKGVRPHAVIVTVAGLAPEALEEARFAELAAAFTQIEPAGPGGATPQERIAALLLGRPGPPPGSDFDVRPRTLFELAHPRGFETAAVVTDRELGEESGLLAGVVHAFDLELLEALRPGAPLEEGLARAASRVDERIGRRREHGLLLWLHLELGGLSPASAADLTHGALVRLAASLGAEPESLLAIWFVPDGPQGAGTLWLHGPTLDGPTLDGAAGEGAAGTLELGELLPRLIGLEDTR